MLPALGENRFFTFLDPPAGPTPGPKCLERKRKAEFEKAVLAKISRAVVRCLPVAWRWCKLFSGPCGGLAVVQAAFRSLRWLGDCASCFPVPAVVSEMG